jgi:hypothetical protein
MKSRFSGGLEDILKKVIVDFNLYKNVLLLLVEFNYSRPRLSSGRSEVLCVVNTDVHC